MSKTFTPDSLLKCLNNDENDELGELISLLENNEQDVKEIFCYLDRLKSDVPDEIIKKIMDFARDYRMKAKQKESVEIK